MLAAGGRLLSMRQARLNHTIVSLIHKDMLDALDLNILNGMANESVQESKHRKT